MSDFFEDEDGSELSSAQMVAKAFSRCSNWPKERIGVDGLVEGLRRASERFGVPEQKIIQRCMEVSGYCPTDFDLTNAARELRPADIQKGPRRCPRDICDGSGWRQIYHMHTKHPKSGGGEWTEKQEITQTMYDDLVRKVDWKTQFVYESRYRCECNPPSQDRIEKHGKYA